MLPHDAVHLVASIFGFFAFANFLLLVWLAIHSRTWKGAHQAGLISEHAKELDMIRSSVGRLTTETLEDRRRYMLSDERIWEELRRISARLDMMRCPMHVPNCPLQTTAPDGEEVWTEEQRAKWNAEHK